MILLYLFDQDNDGVNPVPTETKYVCLLSLGVTLVAVGDSVWS